MGVGAHPPGSRLVRADATSCRQDARPGGYVSQAVPTSPEDAPVGAVPGERADRSIDDDHPVGAGIRIDRDQLRSRMRASTGTASES